MEGHHEKFVRERGLNEAEQDLWFAIDSYEHGMRPVWEGGVDSSTGEVIEGQGTDLTDPRQAALHNGVIVAAREVKARQGKNMNPALHEKINEVSNLWPYISKVFLMEEKSS
jgi:hypothetical protein